MFQQEIEKIISNYDQMLLVSVALISPLQGGTCKTTKCVCKSINAGILGFYGPLSKVC